MPTALSSEEVGCQRSGLLLSLVLSALWTVLYASSVLHPERFGFVDGRKGSTGHLEKAFSF